MLSGDIFVLSNHVDEIKGQFSKLMVSDYSTSEGRIHELSILLVARSPV